MGSRYRVVPLVSGGHGAANEGVCVMEAVSCLWPGQAHTDNPTCVAEPLIGFGQSLNDSLGDSDRQFLWKFVPKYMGTSEDGLNDERARAGLQWLRANYPHQPFYGDETNPNLGGVIDAISSALPHDSAEKARVAEEALSVLMPHEAPSMAKLQWENLQEAYGEEITPSSDEVAAYREAGMAVAI